MVGTVFQGLEQETISLNELLSGDFQENDEIQVFHNDSKRYAVFTFRDGEWKTGPFSADRSPLAVGDSFWIKTPNRSVSVTIKGSVKRGDFLFTTSEGFQMVCVDFPIELQLNGTEIEWTGFQDNDEIQVVDKSGVYKSYRFSQTTKKWMSGPFVADVTLRAGESFWLKAAQAGATIRVASTID